MPRETRATVGFRFAAVGDVVGEMSSLMLALAFGDVAGDVAGEQSREMRAAVGEEAFDGGVTSRRKVLVRGVDAFDDGGDGTSRRSVDTRGVAAGGEVAATP